MRVYIVNGEILSLLFPNAENVSRQADSPRWEIGEFSGKSKKINKQV